jgi:hypothetical protein
MKPPGKTTLNRMQLAAQRERERIEISQDGRVATGMLKKPMPEQVSLRDDFAGIVRLIDSIQADAVLLQRVLRLMRSPAGTPSDAAPVLGAADE